MAPRDKGAWKSETYEATRSAVKDSKETVTKVAEVRVAKGEGMHQLVDPRTHDCTRESNNFFVEHDGKGLILRDGVAIPIKTSIDLTGSMGGEVEKAFDGVPATMQLITGILGGRYHPQFTTAAIQDIRDRFPHQHAEFEPDNEFENQMRLLYPQKGGGDPEEEYQLDLWYSAYRIKSAITKYGLKGYYFIVGDERGREAVWAEDVKNVFGVTLQSDLDVNSLGQEVLKGWHAFYLQVGASYSTTTYWSNVLGPERVISLPMTEDLPYVEAAIIALTEGTLDLQSLESWLDSSSGLKNVMPICRAVKSIPIGLQASYPNFAKIPQKGAIFASKEDIWPIGTEAAADASTPNEPVADGPGWL